MRLVLLRYLHFICVFMDAINATFKVRKPELLLRKINTCLQKNYHLHWLAGRADILRKYIIYIFFNFGRGFCGSFFILFPKAPASSCKKILN